MDGSCARLRFRAAIKSITGDGVDTARGFDRANSVLARLLIEPDLQSGPLILIGHSLGGLLIKQLLRTAESEAHHRTEAADLIQRVTKVAFLATPHTGSGLAVWSDRLRILIRPSAATSSLLRNDPNLRS